MKKILCALLGLILTLPGFAACPSGQVEQTYTSATGTVTQNGTPTPTNPIEPIFYQQGNMILRKVGDYADSYDATTGKITRRVGVKVLNGTEAWSVNAESFGAVFTFVPVPGAKGGVSNPPMCSHFKTNYNTGTPNIANLHIGWSANLNAWIGFRDDNIQQLNDWKSYLVQQAANGTPVTVYYPLATETTEDWNETTYCANAIKIATTAYNSARFSPVVTELNDTIATIRSVVTNTINQTKAIADLQATKQTRPDETCPAGKKCLLVEDDAGQPHWYEIIESASRLPDGFTELQYIESTGTQYIDTGIVIGSTENIVFDVSFAGENAGGWFGAFDGSSYLSPGFFGSDTSANPLSYNIWSQAVQGGTSVILYTTANTKIHIEWQGTPYNGVTVDGTYMGSAQTEPYTPTNKCYLFARNNNGTPSSVRHMRFYNFEVQGRMHLVPARRESDGVLGMYDLVSGQFLTNAGTGTFVAGPEI